MKTVCTTHQISQEELQLHIGCLHETEGFAQFYTVAICTNVNQSQKWTVDPSVLTSVHRTDV
jgi:hypothetical protein